jgi:general secretion pathway protein H
MRTSVRGSERGRPPLEPPAHSGRHSGSLARPPAPRPNGFTLIELLVVIAIVAIGAGLMTLSLRDGTSSRLDREAARLSALLESARAQARAAGLPARWQLVEPDNPDGADFRFVGMPPAGTWPTRWLTPGVRAEIVGAGAVRLGPEPMVGAQRIVLGLDDRRVVVATDGLGPFEPVAEESP